MELSSSEAMHTVSMDYRSCDDGSRSFLVSRAIDERRKIYANPVSISLPACTARSAPSFPRSIARLRRNQRRNSHNNYKTKNIWMYIYIYIFFQSLFVDLSKSWHYRGPIQPTAVRELSLALPEIHFSFFFVLLSLVLTLFESPPTADRYRRSSPITRSRRRTAARQPIRTISSPIRQIGMINRPISFVTDFPYFPLSSINHCILLFFLFVTDTSTPERVLNLADRSLPRSQKIIRFFKLNISINCVCFFFF